VIVAAALIIGAVVGLATDPYRGAVTGPSVAGTTRTTTSSRGAERSRAGGRADRDGALALVVTAGLLGGASGTSVTRNSASIRRA
jgi:hypothetical protein